MNVDVCTYFCLVNDYGATFLMLDFAVWEVRGDHGRKTVREGWISQKVNKALTNRRFRLNRLIDQKEQKPPEISDKQWNYLVTKRATEASKKKSARMRNVSKGKGTRSTQRAALREAAIVKLVSHSFCNVRWSLELAVWMFGECVELFCRSSCQSQCL